MTPIERARDRHRLAAVAGRTGIPVPSSAGGTVTVRCPFPSHGHPDRTPSLRLYLHDDRFYCFGCAAKGDVVQWACDTERVGVAAAIAILDSGHVLTNAWAGKPDARGEATRRSLGLAAPAERPDIGRSPVASVLAALDAAWNHCIAAPLHDLAVAYLSDRGIDVGVLEVHTGRTEAGHTPTRSDGLVAALRADGFGDDELVDAGVARRYPDGPLRDFYRQRILIPVRDDQQRIVGLVGRNVGDQARWAKYANPPLTAVYDKSVNLYQPLPAPNHPYGRVVVVEGTLDALAIAVAAIRTGQADRYCPLTQSGRELSDLQIRQIGALHPEPAVLAFDADTAGRDSARRYQVAFASQRLGVSTATLPPGHDPASWLAAAGPQALARLTRDLSPPLANRNHPRGSPSIDPFADIPTAVPSPALGL
jgi:DNA primase